MALTPRQRRFVLAYVVNPNAAAAARAAGYAHGSAKVTAARLLTNANVQAEIARRQAKVSSELEITAENVLLSMARVAFADPRRLFDKEGMLRPVHELDDDMAGAISSVEVVTRQARGGKPGEVEYVRKIRLSSRTEAQANLARHFGLLDGDGSSERARTSQAEWAAATALLTPEQREHIRRSFEMVEAAKRAAASETPQIEGESEDVTDQDGNG
jgi:phage terminase small subunit